MNWLHLHNLGLQTGYEAKNCPWIWYFQFNCIVNILLLLFISLIINIVESHGIKPLTTDST